MDQRRTAVTVAEQQPAWACDLQFPDGLVGLPEWHRFHVVANWGREGVFLLECLDEDLRFLAIDPRELVAGYGGHLPPEDLAALGLAGADGAVVLALLTVERGPLRITANLLGPVVINPATGTARQLVLAESPFTTRYPVHGPDASTAEKGCARNAGADA